MRKQQASRRMVVKLAVAVDDDDDDCWELGSSIGQGGWQHREPPGSLPLPCRCPAWSESSMIWPAPSFSTTDLSIDD